MTVQHTPTKTYPPVLPGAIRVADRAQWAAVVDLVKQRDPHAAAELQAGRTRHFDLAGGDIRLECPYPAQWGAVSTTRPPTSDAEAYAALPYLERARLKTAQPEMHARMRGAWQARREQLTTDLPKAPRAERANICEELARLEGR
jgi:hypothetical protein